VNSLKSVYISFRNLVLENLLLLSNKSVSEFVLSFLVCLVLIFILGKMYVKFGHSLSNRESFAKNFLMLGMTTMFIIIIIKSSLALSLGLVGALSIVRFRSAIKEPEELTYLFTTIAIGLGCGAGQVLITIIAFIGFAFVIWFNSRGVNFAKNQSLYLSIQSEHIEALNTNKIIEILNPNVEFVKLKNYQESETTFDIGFWIEFKNMDKLQLSIEQLKAISPKVSISLFDNTRDS
jgi:hypothetical protein